MAVPSFAVVTAAVLRMARSEIAIDYATAVQRAKEEFNLTEEDMAETIDSGTNRLKSRVQWAVTYLSQAGLLVRPKRGFFELTPLGKELQSKDHKSIARNILLEYDSFADFQGRKKEKSADEISDTSTTLQVSGQVDYQSSDIDDESSETPLDTVERISKQINKTFKQELLSEVLRMSPEFFERLVVRLLTAMGYGDSKGEGAKSVGKSGDGGIDGIISEDTLGLNAVYVQAKRYAEGTTVGTSDLRNFLGALEEQSATKGVFFTTSTFTKGVYENVEKTNKRVILIDGSRLVDLMTRYGVGVLPVQSYTFYDIDKNIFDEDI